MIAKVKSDSAVLRSIKLGRPVEANDETEEGLHHGIERPSRASTEPIREDDLGSGPDIEGPVTVATELVLVTETPQDDPWMPHEGGVHRAPIEPVAGDVTHSTCDNVEWRTSLMLSNLPLDYTRDMLLHLLDKEGFAGKYDFIYLPVDFKTRAGPGYGFLNMVSPTEAELVHTCLDGFNSLGSAKQQGLHCCMEHSGTRT